jgi:beta-xylosidase
MGPWQITENPNTTSKKREIFALAKADSRSIEPAITVWTVDRHSKWNADVRT